MKKYLIFLLILGGCIGTDVVPDFVEPTIIIQNSILNLQVGDSHQLSAIYLDNTGRPAANPITWSSSNEQILSISQEGLATGVSEGFVFITAQSNEVMSSIEVEVSMRATELMNVRTAEIQTTSSYPLSGLATLSIDEMNSSLALSADFLTDDRLPGLYLYLTNNPNTIDNALELGPVKEFEGAQTYEVPQDVELFTYNYVLFYCKPFNVKVGDGELNP